MSESKSELRRPFFYDFTLADSTFYFSMFFYNALCRGNLDNDQVEILEVFPDIPADRGLVYFGIYKFKSYLLLSPYCNKDDLLVYDIEHAKFSKLHNKGEIEFYSSAVFESKEDLYIVSKKTAEVNKINIQKHSVECLSFPGYMTENARICEIVRVRHLLYIPFNAKKILLIFDMDKEELIHRDFPENISFIATISYWNDKFWLTGSDRKIYTWKLGEKKAEAVAEFPDEVKLFYDGGIWFANSLIHENILWLFPCYSDLILKYNLHTKKTETVKIAVEEESAEQLEEELKSGRYLVEKYNIVQKCGNYAFFRSSKTRLLYELNLQDDNIHAHDLRVKNIYNQQIYPPATDGVMLEKSYTDGLKFLIKTLNKQTTNKEKRHDQTVGKIINMYMNK